MILRVHLSQQRLSDVRYRPVAKKNEVDDYERLQYSCKTRGAATRSTLTFAASGVADKERLNMPVAAGLKLSREQPAEHSTRILFHESVRYYREQSIHEAI